MYSGPDNEVKHHHDNLKKRASVLLPMPENGGSVVQHLPHRGKGGLLHRKESAEDTFDDDGDDAPRTTTERDSTGRRTVFVRGKQFKTNSHVELKATLKQIDWDNVDELNGEEVVDPFAEKEGGGGPTSGFVPSSTSSSLPPVGTVEKRPSVIAGKGVVEMTPEAYVAMQNESSDAQLAASRKTLDSKSKELLGAMPTAADLKNTLRKETDNTVRSEMRVAALRSKIEQASGGDVGSGARLRNTEIVIDKAPKKIGALGKTKSVARFAEIEDEKSKPKK